MSLARRSPAKRTREPTIALINVVFLMLVFFMVAGTVAPPLSRDIRLVDAGGLGRAAPPDALVLMADGTLLHRGALVADPAAWFARHGGAAARLVPDHDSPAARLDEVARALRQAGAERVLIVTERGLR
ncbi:MAG: biopolymer transporter ExbD [Paracoccaceae bacterium]|jgi:biopolymer transport protein ExbD|nr:biopolymer transporter ExbD [Paracoccaceae bacterium]